MGINPQRLALIYIRADDGEFRQGTGYLVTDRHIITALHVVHDSSTPQGHAYLLGSGRKRRDVSLIWQSKKADSCLLELSEPEPELATFESIHWGEFLNTRTVD